MAARSNACSEITRLWLEARHGCLVSESVPVAVPRGHSDIDLIATQAGLHAFALPGGLAVGPRLIVETKDEHDFDPKGKEFGTWLLRDVDKLGANPFVPKGVQGTVKFSMLREQHFLKATELFGSPDFDRLFVVHAIDPATLSSIGSTLLEKRIHWITIDVVVRDLLDWYKLHPRPTSLRNSLMGDLWHLLFGYCRADFMPKNV